MNDLISKKTAIYALKLAISAILRAEGAEPETQRWIPVTERLPEKDGPYLVSGNSEIWICEFIHIGILKGWSNPANRPRVKAWMPLPEPPKDGE